MSLCPAITGALIPQATTESIWIADDPHPNYGFPEGTTVRFAITCRGPVPGKSKLIWKLAGGRAGSGWSKDWYLAWSAACSRRGMTVTRLDGNANQATVALLFEVNADYDGQPIYMDNTILENRVTDYVEDGLMRMYIQLALPAGSTGITVGNGRILWARDTSQTPPGTPTFNLFGRGLNGAGLNHFPPEGYAFELVLGTEYIAPGCSFLVYAANAGQNKLEPDFRSALKAAAEAKGCTCAIDYATVGPYTGGIVTIGTDYDDSDPIVIPLTITEDHRTTGTQQLDFIVGNFKDGNPVKPTHVGGTVVSLFVQDTSVEPTPTYWRADAYRDAGGLHYSLTSPSGVTAASVDFRSSGNVPAGFAAALAAAIAAKTGLSMAGTTISSTTAWDGSLSWSVPNPGGTGKHCIRLTNPQPAESRIVVADAVVYFTSPVLPPQSVYISGVNLAGGEFGGNVPGTYADDYRYPAFPEWGDFRDLTYHAAKGSHVFRLPVRWERIQHDLFGELSNGGDVSTWSGPLDMARIDQIVTWATSRGIVLLLDLHNYMRRYGVLVDVASDVPIHALSDVWVRLAERYAGNPGVWFGIMNEPNGITSRKVFDIMTAVVNAIRSRTSALNPVLVTGTDYSGGATWVSQGNGDVFRNYRDPAGNHRIEIHQYADSDASGTKGTCAADAGTRLDAVTDWARTYGHRLFCGEIAGGDPAIDGQQACGTVVPALLAKMDTNRDVWCGFTAWAGGGRWPANYPFVLDPPDLGNPVDTGPMRMILPYLKRVD